MARHGKNIRKRKDGRWEAAIRFIVRRKEYRFTGLYMADPMKRYGKN